MKKVLLYIILLSSCVLCSCDIETSSNGDLDGNWYLTKWEETETGTVKDYRQERVFWSFQGKIMQTHQKGGSPNSPVIYKFNHKGNILHVSNPYLSIRVKGDVEITEESIETIKHHGISALEENFTVEHLSSSRMTLNNDKGQKFYFVKY